MSEIELLFVAIGLLALAILANAVSKIGGGRSRGYGGYSRAYPWRRRKDQWNTPKIVQPEPAVPPSDVAAQIRAVSAGPFQKQRILSMSEYRVFQIVEFEVASIRMGHRVFAQTCLGEVLRSQSEDAYRAINSKRVDILVVDSGGWPVLAVEYQGPGHYQNDAIARDAIKKEALRKAGVRYYEVLESDTPEMIATRIRDFLGQHRPPRPSSGDDPSPVPVH